MTRFLRSLALGAALCSALSCSNSSPAPAPTPTAAVTLQSVALAAALSNLTVAGRTAQIIATGTFSNSTTQDVTASCTGWLSSNSSVATINATGLITAVGSGTATVTATCQGVAARGTLTLTLNAPTPVAVFTINGTVTDGTSRGVLPNIDVQVTAGTNASRATKTDSAGKYSLTGLSAGTFAIAASATGYVTTVQNGTLAANTAIDFVLPRMTSSGPTGPTCSASSVPSGVTAVCNDGSFSMSQNRSGTCSSHQGVACWVCPGPLCQ